MTSPRSLTIHSLQQPWVHFLSVQIPWLTRLLCPWGLPGKNTGVGCHFLLQGTVHTQGSNPGLLPCRQTLYPLSHQGSHHFFLYIHSVIVFNLLVSYPYLLLSHTCFLYCLCSTFTTISQSFSSSVRPFSFSENLELSHPTPSSQSSILLGCLLS